MKKVTVFETVHEHAAGIDIGAEKIYVSYDGTEVVTFDTYTADYYRCAVYLQEKGIKDVAMEAPPAPHRTVREPLDSYGSSR